MISCLWTFSKTSVQNRIVSWGCSPWKRISSHGNSFKWKICTLFQETICWSHPSSMVWTGGGVQELPLNRNPCLCINSPPQRCSDPGPHTNWAAAPCSRVGGEGRRQVSLSSSPTLLPSNRKATPSCALPTVNITHIIFCLKRELTI